MQEEIEYLDELFNVWEAVDCLQDKFGIDQNTAKIVIAKWAEKIYNRYSCI